MSLERSADLRFRGKDDSLIEGLCTVRVGSGFDLKLIALASIDECDVFAFMHVEYLFGFGIGATT